jgi:hypothetical protein
MNIFEMAAVLPIERMVTKYTGGRSYPTREEIAGLAYRFYEMHGRRDGHDVEDWLAAEGELTRHYSWSRPERRFITQESN